MPNRSAQMASDPPSDHGSLDEIFLRYVERLRDVAARLTGDAQKAADLIQDTYLRATERFAQFRQGTNAGAWLVTILTNLFFDGLKHDTVIAKAIPGLIIHFGYVEGDPILENISDDQLRAAIEQLEPDLREVIHWRLRGMRCREIAEQLGVPSSTIGTRLLRARARLKALLAPDLED
jgi:RNA polymerase sigma-70 factor, ECF subfamily